MPLLDIYIESVDHSNVNFFKFKHQKLSGLVSPNTSMNILPTHVDTYVENHDTWNLIDHHYHLRLNRI